MKCSHFKVHLFFFTIITAGFLTAGKAYAGSYITGHAYVNYLGAKVYLKSVGIKWEQTQGAISGGPACQFTYGDYRLVATNNPISSTTHARDLSDPTNKVTETLDCRTQQMGYGDTSPACQVNSFNQTIDAHNNINYVFPRIDCYGCNYGFIYHVMPSFPAGYSLLPSGLDPGQGSWRWVEAESQAPPNTVWDPFKKGVKLVSPPDSSDIILEFEWVPTNMTPTPTTTSVPTPTPTSSPPTPTPTAPPSSPTPTTIAPSPTPTQPVACMCAGVNVSGDLAPGKTLTAIAKAKVVDPFISSSTVQSVNFTLSKNGTALTSSGTIPVAGAPTLAPSPTVDPASGQRVNFYQTSWNFTVPTGAPTDAGKIVSYHVDAATTCARKTAAIPNYQAGVLGVTDNPGSIIGFLLSLFSQPEPTPTVTPQPPVRRSLTSQSRVETITQGDVSIEVQVVAPEGQRSLQLGGFSILSPTPALTINPQCTFADFDVLY